MRRIHNLAILALSGLLAVEACGDGATEPTGQAFDPTTVSQDVQAVGNAFETDVYRSLDALGGAFTIPGANLSIAAARSLAGEADAGPADLVALSRRIAASYSGAASLVLIPEQYRGLTLTYDPIASHYSVDETRTGAPTNGIRFILYAVNPVTGAITTPLNEIGSADLLDESTAATGVVRLVVVSGTTEYINYTTALSGTILTPSVNINGFVTDGTTRVDIDLINSIAVTIGGATISVDYTIAVPTRDFEVTAVLTIVADSQGEEVSFGIDVQFTAGTDQVRIAGELVNGAGSLNVTVNGDVFAVVTMAADSIVVAGPDGVTPLTPAEAAALEQVIDGFQKAFDSFDTFFHPVEFLFGGADG